VPKYVDDSILAFSCDPRTIPENVQRLCKLKSDTIEPLKFTVGAKLQEKPQYHTVLDHHQSRLRRKRGRSVENKGMETSLGEVDTPMSNSYTPELDVAEAL
jgi:hypothetical protein